jgi:alkylation response protein AidB-like acyl-CoA dehydrogenase
VDALKAAKIFRMAMPHAWGGLQLDPLAQFEVLEALTMADASTGWCAYIGSGSGGFLTTFLDQNVAREMYRDVDTITGGAVRPAGRATVVPGGYRVSGRWPFGSGCHHCTWLTSGCVLYDGDSPRLTAQGLPDIRICFLPADHCDILDTWTTTGLRGSASHDYAASDLFVPEEHTFSLVHSPIQRAEPLYAFRTLFLFGHAAIPLGIARSAIEALIALAAQKAVPSGPGAAAKGLRDEAYLQSAVARAEALVGAARAYVVDVLHDLWTTLVRASGSVLPMRTPRGSKRLI